MFWVEVCFYFSSFTNKDIFFTNYETKVFWGMPTFNTFPSLQSEYMVIKKYQAGRGAKSWEALHSSCGQQLNDYWCETN